MAKLTKKQAQQLRENVIKGNKKLKPKRLTQNQIKKKYFTKTEFQEQNELTRWIKQHYPEILFSVDLAGINLSKAQRQIYYQRCKKGQPDIMIHEWCKDLFCGLDIELKRKDIIVNEFALSKNTENGKHLRQQHQFIMDLRKRQRLSFFVSGADNAKKVIELYFKGDRHSLEQINHYVFPRFDFSKVFK